MNRSGPRNGSADQHQQGEHDEDRDPTAKKASARGRSAWECTSSVDSVSTVLRGEMPRAWSICSKPAAFSPVTDRDDPDDQRQQLGDEAERSRHAAAGRTR
jgi:hypothetical protein